MRAFSELPLWYQADAVGQTVKSPVRAMLAATQRGSTLLNVGDNIEKDTPDDPETSWISETKNHQGCESYPARQNSASPVSQNL